MGGLTRNLRSGVIDSLRRRENVLVAVVQGRPEYEFCMTIGCAFGGAMIRLSRMHVKPCSAKLDDR
jgi:hypothetical protein